jgi:hypothetical protein
MHAQSKEASSTSGKRRLAEGDAHRWITQNHREQEYGHDLASLRNIIDDKSRNIAQMLSPQWRSAA